MNKADWLVTISWLILGIIPIILKLTEVISWSWLWATSFLWIPATLVAVMLILFVLCMWLAVSQQR
jgi:hypothetical protein